EPADRAGGELRNRPGIEGLRREIGRERDRRQRVGKGGRQRPASSQVEAWLKRQPVGVHVVQREAVRGDDGGADLRQGAVGAHLRTGVHLEARQQRKDERGARRRFRGPVYYFHFLVSSIGLRSVAPCFGDLSDASGHDV